MKRRISLSSGARVSAQEHDERRDPDHVHDEDRERSTDAAAHQPANRRIEQVDEQQPDDEWPDAVARHPEQQPDDDRGRDEDGDPRRERSESCPARARRGIEERGRRQRGCPTSQVHGGSVWGRWRGLLHGAADYQTWMPAQRQLQGRDGRGAGRRGRRSSAPALAPGPRAGRPTRPSWGAGRRSMPGRRPRGVRVAALPDTRAGAAADRLRGADPGQAGAGARAGRHRPHRVRPDVAGAGGPRRPPARRAGGWSTSTMSGSAARPSPDRSSRPTTGSR